MPFGVRKSPTPLERINHLGNLQYSIIQDISLQLHLLIRHGSVRRSRWTLLRLQRRFDFLKPTQIQPRAGKHHGKIKDAEYPGDAEIEPYFGVKYVESSSLCPVRSFIPSRWQSKANRKKESQCLQIHLLSHIDIVRKDRRYRSAHIPPPSQYAPGYSSHTFAPGEEGIWRIHSMRKSPDGREPRPPGSLPASTETESRSTSMTARTKTPVRNVLEERISRLPWAKPHTEPRPRRKTPQIRRKRARECWRTTRWRWNSQSLAQTRWSIAQKAWAWATCRSRRNRMLLVPPNPTTNRRNTRCRPEGSRAVRPEWRRWWKQSMNRSWNLLLEIWRSNESRETWAAVVGSAEDRWSTSRKWRISGTGSQWQSCRGGRK